MKSDKETTKVLQAYNEACNRVLEAFCNKHEFCYEDALRSWVGDEVGGVVACGDYYFSMADIITDLMEEATDNELFSWYEYTLDCNMLGLPTVNYHSWLHGCPLYSEERLEHIRKLQKNVAQAKLILHEEIKLMKNEPY